MAPTNTPTPEPTPATATLPLGVYLTLCAPPEQELADDATFGDLSSVLAAEADRLEALTPPAQLSEWHLLNIEAYRTAQAGVDTQPKDDVMVDNPTINAVEDDFVEKLRAAAARVPKDVRRQMIEAGCIDPEEVPDDHGNDIDDATAIRVGADVRGALDYDGDIDFFRFQAEQGQSYQIDVALGTLDDSIVELYHGDGSFLDTNDDYGDTLASRLYWNAPSSGERYVFVGGYGVGTYTLTVSLSDVIDDHANSEVSATAIRVGADVRGAMDYDGDIDFFRFQAEQGESYQIDVALGTLDDSIVELYDADGSFLDTNDDYGDTLASRLSWNAPSSGERYVLVWGAYTSSRGTYTLTVSLSDVIDDHANSEGDATVAAVGADVEGALDYDGDIDYFRFQAEQGQSYQIDVALGTLDDSIVELYDADGSFLDTNDDYGDTLASRLYWNAPSSGERYVFVGGYGTGTYTLTVSLSDVIDDHGNSEGDATAIGVGADVRGALDYDGDVDFFRFQAEQGESYQIDVALGTLDDSIVELYDVGWSFLDSNDDYGDTYASRLYWEAPSSGERYVAVEGFGIGTYTLTVSLVDDHGDTAEDGVGVASDRAALVALYNAMEGGSWTTRTNWLSGRPLDEWHGVTTDSGGRVTALNLSSNSLDGALPAALGDLTNLESLRLSENPLTGRIPAELGDLTNLRELHLGSQGYGRLTGPIPAALGDLTNLESLVLSNNELTGPIPAWLGDLTNLVVLNLWSNQLTGPIPAELGDLSNLESLVLGWNELTGPIPAWLGDLSNLVELLLPVTQLTGPIPAELGDLSNLQWLDLSFNYLTGPIPAALGDLSNLEFLDLGTNRLTGPIPAELSNLSNLSELQLLGNQLTGCVPVGLRDVAEENDLGELELPDCGLEGRPSADSFVSVSAGVGHTCGMRSDGSVACWGLNSDGQATPPAGSFVSVSAKGSHTCGVRSDGSVACWGYNGNGRATPPAGSFVSVNAGGNHTCGVRSNGSVVCWGYNEYGQATPPAGFFVSVSAGAYHTCGVRSNGSVACWGSDYLDGDYYGQATPPAGSFVSVSAGFVHTCGVRSNGSVACWGRDDDGQATPPAGPFVSLSAGQGHTCGVRSNGSVACWGRDDDGQATPPAGLFVSVNAGPWHTCGVRSNGSVACWGSDEFGQATPPAVPSSP